jgi:DNA-binding LytR/AlgR family response regulator
LKPVQYNDLQAAFQKYEMLKEKFLNQHFLAEFSDFIRNRPSKKYKKNFIVHQGNAAHVIKDHEISYFIKDDIIFLVANEKRWVMESRSLDEIENLVDPSKFFRANRQCLINRDIIAGYKSDASGKLLLKLKCGDPGLSVSREKATEFRRWLESES